MERPAQRTQMRTRMRMRALTRLPCLELHFPPPLLVVLLVLVLLLTALAGGCAGERCDAVPTIEDDLPAPLCDALTQYAHWHAAHRDKPDTPAVVFHATVGGFHDRLRGLAAALLLCMAERRLLFVESLLPSQDTLLGPGTIDARVPAWANNEGSTSIRCSTSLKVSTPIVKTCSEALALARDATGTVGLAWNAGAELLKGSISLADHCFLSRCIGVTFWYLFTFARGMQPVQSLLRGTVAALGGDGGYDAMLLRTANASLNYGGQRLKLTTFEDGLAGERALQHMHDTLLKCDPSAPSAPVFVASDSALLKALLQRGGGRRFFSCCWHPKHVDRASGVDAQHEMVYQLMLDIEVAARARTIFFVQGGFYRVPLHWRTYGPGVEVIRLTEATPQDPLCGVRS